MFRLPKRLPRTLLSVLLAGSLTGCMAGGDGPANDTNDGATQLIRGSIPLSHYTADVVGVRVVSGTEQVSTAATDTNGNFSIAVPVGQNYAFEIVTKSGTHPVLTGPINGQTPMHFDVCAPGEDFDLGDIDPLDFEEIDGDDTPWTDTEDECEVPPWLCEDDGLDENGDGFTGCIGVPLPCDAPDSDQDFCWDEPLPCEAPDADADFCIEDPPLPCSDPGADPNECWDSPPPPPPPLCDAPDADPDFCWDVPPPPPCEDDGLDENGDGFIGCHDEPLPCGDPNSDPDFCIDDPPQPCDFPDADPDLCGGECHPNDPFCGEGGDPWEEECEGGYDEPSCWPEPDICIVTPDGDFSECDEGIGGAPEFPFPDFGCEGEDYPETPIDSEPEAPTNPEPEAPIDL